MSDTAGADYFALLELPPSFDIDMGELQKRYFEAQRKFHPDRLTGKTQAERNRAIAQSMQANAAYETLKSPHARARYLLARQGIQVGGEQDSHAPSPALLMETLEAREALAEAQTMADVEAIETGSKKAQADVLTRLSAAFTQDQWLQAADLTLRLGYLLKLDDEIRIRRKYIAKT